MPKRRNYTQELLAKRNDGALIVVSLAPYTGVPVVYAPRNRTDPEPWTGGLEYRFSGRECHAVKVEPVSKFACDRLLNLIFELSHGVFEMDQNNFRFDFSTSELVLLLAKLVENGYLKRQGGSYFITRSGYSHLADLQEDAA